MGGGDTLPVIDPEKSLQRSGGKVAYTSGLKLQEPARITASIDDSGKIMEENERNNRMTVTLDPADAGKRHSSRSPKASPSCASFLSSPKRGEWA